MHYDPLGEWVKEHDISSSATARDIISNASITDLKIMVNLLTGVPSGS